MPRAEAGSAKAIGNAIKAKGEQLENRSLATIAHSFAFESTYRSRPACLVLSGLSETMSGRERIQDALAIRVVSLEPHPGIQLK
jgi:hypothetical protein